MRVVVLGIVLALPLVTGCAGYHARPLEAPARETAYRARTLESAELRSFVETSLGSAQPAWPRRSLDLKRLTFVGCYNSPEFEVARAQIVVAEAAIHAAGARVNPRLGLQGGWNPESHRECTVSPSFTIETAGKRGYRTLRTEHEADAARVGLVEARRHLRGRIRAAFINQLLATERFDLLQREQIIRAEIVQIFDRRLAVGEAARPELGVYRVDMITT